MMARKGRQDRQALYQLHGLRKSYAQRLILDIEQLALERGNSYLITGSNGAGKTTLLRILAGLESAEILSCSFDGMAFPADEIVQRLAPRVVYMHQQPYLFSTSVASNIAFGLKASDIAQYLHRAMVEDAMKWAGVEHVAHVSPYRLSGGEKQRVALARAKVLNPDVLLLDEPTASLDEEARIQVNHLIRQMCDNNHCVVIATHDPELIALEHATHWRLHHAKLSAN
jgi:tungstate transport system ATP-binding protein